MKYNFDEVINRRSDKYSYSVKWAKNDLIKEYLGADVNDETIPLFTADMDFRCAPQIIEALQGVASHGIFGYSIHMDEYFEAVINWFKRRHKWEILPEEIVYVNGTVEAIKQVILAFTEKGDGVIIQRPVYTPFSSTIMDTERVIVNNQLLVDDKGNYTMDFKDLEEKAKKDENKLLILCNPHNPVGKIWSDDELISLARICKENNVIIMADEIHGDLIRKEAVFHPIATLADNSNIITATAVNKTFNLAGLHCTNLVIKNKEIRDKFQKSLGMVMPSPFTIAAVIAAYNESEDWLDSLKEYLDDNIDFVINFLKERMPKVKCKRPEGSYIIWMDFREYGLTAEEIHDKIYNKANVLLEGGIMFDPDKGAGFERVCVPTPRSIIKEAFERIAKEFEGL